MLVKLDKIINGGQSLGTLEDGRKALVWGGLPGESVDFRITKKKSSFVEGIAEEIISPASTRVDPLDPTSYLSTSPWQIMDFNTEQMYKSQLIKDAFDLSDVDLSSKVEIFSDNKQFHYRNKIEFSWYGDTDDKTGKELLDLAFFRRGSKGKIVVDGTSLASPEINQLAQEVRDLLRQKNISARNLKTLLIRSSKSGQTVWQLYLKDKLPNLFSETEAMSLSAQGGEVIYSNPKSPASVITERLASFGYPILTDTLLGKTFNYATEGFFQINLPVYEQVLADIKEWIPGNAKTTDFYSGVGTIGLTVNASNTILVEINESAVREMERNIEQLGINARPILAPSENALDYIESDRLIIVDPPRAGLHDNVVSRLIDQLPPKIIYLSCNPVTQARDIKKLEKFYKISHVVGYNFFPRTPHIENLVVLDRK